MQMDKVLTGKYTALPVFFGVMFLIFYLTFNLIGQNLSDFLSLGIDKLTMLADKGLTAYGINPVVHRCTADSSEQKSYTLGKVFVRAVCTA